VSNDEFREWIDGLASGNAQAAQAIWEQYYTRLMRLADRRLGSSRRTVVGPEDVVQSAMGSFCRGLRAGRFPRLDDELDLWKILVTITARKAFAELRRQKRRASAGESVLGGMGGIGQVLGNEPTPEIAAIAMTEFERLMDLLHDENLRKIALMKWELYTRGEIARELGCSETTVKRACQQIREKWLRAFDHEQ
jgi:RNA polymerase sigma factor (sigma-70 family)